MNEWSLLIFTIAIPIAVGGMLFLWYVSKWSEKNNLDIQEMARTPIIVLAVLSLIGLISAFFHLGSPTNAIFMIKGFGRSWMSNEIVFSGVFIGLTVLLAVLALLKKRISPIILLVNGIVGLIAIFSMATLYTVTQVSGWDHINTYLGFFATAFVLGPLLVAGLLSPSLDKEDGKVILKQAFVLSVLGICLQVIGSAMFTASMHETQMIASEIVQSKLTPYSSMIGFRWIIEIIGLCVLGYLALGRKAKLQLSVMYAALLVVVIAEGMYRYVFYVLGS